MIECFEDDSGMFISHRCNSQYLSSFLPLLKRQRSLSMAAAWPFTEEACRYIGFSPPSSDWVKKSNLVNKTWPLVSHFLRWSIFDRLSLQFAIPPFHLLLSFLLWAIASITADIWWPWSLTGFRSLRRLVAAFLLLSQLWRISSHSLTKVVAIGRQIFKRFASADIFWRELRVPVNDMIINAVPSQWLTFAILNDALDHSVLGCLIRRFHI